MPDNGAYVMAARPVIQEVDSRRFSDEFIERVLVASGLPAEVARLSDLLRSVAQGIADEGMHGWAADILADLEQRDA